MKKISKGGQKLIDLGAVAKQTKGPAGVPSDTFNGLKIHLGLTDD